MYFAEQNFLLQQVVMATLSFGRETMTELNLSNTSKHIWVRWLRISMKIVFYYILNCDNYDCRDPVLIK